jgi:type IV pilus assembly protein PilY1
MKFFRNNRLWVGLLALPLALFVVFKVAVALTAFNPSDQPTGYVAQDEMTSYNLKSGVEFLFRGQFEREYWSGGFLAYPADKLGNVDTAAPAWDTAEALALQDFDTGRFIATLRDDGVAVPFRLGSLSVAQQAFFGGNTDLVNFLRGDRSNEGSPFRIRSTVLGDIMHSRPIYVRDATSPTVFVGANDGMLHAINAATPSLGTGIGGSERWAYVPSMLLPKMKKLAANPYLHDYFVDGQINVATVESGSRRMLVGGLGAGGKGLYALDITDSDGLTAASEADVASKVMWEISPTKVRYAAPATTNAYVNLGYTYGTVTIAKMNVAGTLTDVIIVGNGYNDGLGDYAGCTNVTPSYAACDGNYQAYLYVINAVSGQLIKSIKAGTSGSSVSPNGLSTPSAIDVDGDGTVDRVYAGDLNGTMWKFDLAAGTVSALLVTSPAQAITMTPAVAIHPEGGYMVNFATGKMFITADTTDTTVHYAYGAWDGAPSANAVLLSQTITERNYVRGGVTTRVRRVTSNQPNWTSDASNHKGWQVALPAGEKVLGEGTFVENGRFYFTSHNPTVSTQVPNTSTYIAGENWLMELDYLTGGSKNQPFLDLSADIKLDDDDRIRYISSDSEVVSDPTKLDKPIPTTDGISVGKFISTGVLSQPILVQLLSLNDTLFNQNPDVIIPAVVLGQGVDGGHFDQDIYYGIGAASKAVGSVKFVYASPNSKENVTNLVITAKGETLYSGSPGNNIKPVDLDDFLDGKSSANYRISANFNNSRTIKIEAKTAGAAGNGAIAVTISTSGSSPGAEIVNLAGGLDASGGDSCTNCRAKNHIHQYDDKYDVTGVNMLNASNTAQNLVNAIPNAATEFKVIAQNQYLSPAVQVHIGTPGYLFDVNQGYIRIKDFVTSATLDLATLPTYRRASTASGTAKPIESLAVNMPTDALTARDWWGSGDVRVGLHPTVYYCAYSSAGTNDGNMYRPVVPPANGIDGPGVNGWSGSTTPATATGARHNGALTFQLIAANTPNSAIELNLPGRPEYGWRVKSSEFKNYVLAEYNTYWHHPNGKCYGDTGWSKTPGPDNGSSTAGTKAAGSTDPKIGELGVGAGSITDITTTIAGDVTTTVITYSSGLTATIKRTANRTGGVLDGSVTIVTKDTQGKETTQVIASAKGSIRSGGDERGLQARTGRISWRELVAP